jgi:hypothetical protein
LLDQNCEVLERVQGDLNRGLKNPSKGRHGLNRASVGGLARSDAHQELATGSLKRDEA